MRKAIYLTLLLTTLGVAAIAIAAGVEDGKPQLGASFTAHTLPKPADFVSLEDWAASNYTEYLLTDTIQPSTAGELEAITFSSRNRRGTDFNLLFDNGRSLVLVTTSRISPAGTDTEEARPKAQAVASCDTATNRCNCVLYARCKVPRLPFGLFTYTDKKAIINSSSAAVGSVAIMNIAPPYGHVAVVTAVKKDIRTRQVTSITVNEANYSSCRITTRSGSPASLKVTGYFKP